MLFNSLLFICVFLPVCLTGFFLLGHFRKLNSALVWLIACSLFFYGWWNPKFLWIIIVSVLCNYGCGMILLSLKHYRKWVLGIGIVCNLALLAYFKYAKFFLDTLSTVSGSEFRIAAITLPLAISFFTFQQIAYLVDRYKRKVQDSSFLHYALFVTFFPQLIAGPIVHHADILPQFIGKSWHKLQSQHLAVGITIFMIGLCKKVVLADSVAPYSTLVFSSVATGVVPTFVDSWIGALAYTLQLYFDFSGYSDMAIGAARMFGIVLPLNFYSPYKAKSIIDFWRRWHITLSQFLRDYLYIPLGGNRSGVFRMLINIFITMLLGGLWHGAGWTFVFWGGLHGVYLVINHLWRRLHPASVALWWKNMLSVGLTFLTVVVSWVFFRADSFSSAISIIKGMIGFHADSQLGIIDAYTLKPALLVIAVLLAMVWLLPNTQQYMADYSPSLAGEKYTKVHALLRWKPHKAHAALLSIITIVSFTFLVLSQQSEFLYFQF